MPKLTETFAKKAPQSKAKTVKYWDNEIKGFALFVGKTSKTWYFQRDVGGKTQRVHIGRYPMISAQVARQTALDLALEMGRGAGRQLQIGAPTLREAIEAYLERPKLRSEKHKTDLRGQFELHLGDWLALPIDQISKHMVVERHRKLGDRPSAANHLLRNFRTVWNHTRRVYDLTDSPTQAIEWYDERGVGAIIEDLGEWRRTINGLSNPIHTVYYELLLFTGFRKTEALDLEWRHIHEDRIHLPTTKNGRPFDLPILPLHHEILAPLKGLHRQWVFPSPKSQSNRLSAPQRMAWSPHTHRRTFATVAVEAGVLEEVAGRLLNHTPQTITGQRYVKPSLDALRPAMETVCAELVKRTSTS